MKKYLWILLLIPSLCWSATGDLQTIGGKVDTAITSIAGKAGTAIATICGKNYTDGDSTSCSAVTDYVGYTTEGNTGSSSTADRITAQLHTPTCTSGCTSGNIATAYIYHPASAETGENVKVCIYSDDGDEAPDDGDELIYCTGAITSTTDAEWRTAAVSGSYPVSCGSKYWVAHVAEGVFRRAYDSVGTYYYMASSYASPPDTLDGTWSSTARTISIYFTVGP